MVVVVGEDDGRSSQRQGRVSANNPTSKPNPSDFCIHSVARGC